MPGKKEKNVATPAIVEERYEANVYRTIAIPTID
jgi:hypothetical protein